MKINTETNAENKLKIKVNYLFMFCNSILYFHKTIPFRVTYCVCDYL